MAGGSHRIRKIRRNIFVDMHNRYMHWHDVNPLLFSNHMRN